MGYHKDTEFLTESGWKNYEDIKEDDLLAQFNINTKELFYKKYLGKTKAFSNNLICIEGHNVSQCIDPSQNVLLNNSNIEAVSLCNNPIKEEEFILSVKNENLQRYDIDDNILKLVVFSLMDGTIVYENTRLRRIQFKLSKQRKIDSLREILEKAGIKYTFKLCKKHGLNKLQPYYIRIYTNEAKKIEQYIPHKNMPLWFSIVNEHQARIILDIISETDGTRHYNSISWTSIKKQEMDIIQRMCINNGFISKYKLEKDGTFENAKPLYKNSIYYNNKPGLFFNIKVKELPYNDQTVGFITPSGTLLTRFNGKLGYSRDSIKYPKTLTKHTSSTGSVEVAFNRNDESHRSLILGEYIRDINLSLGGITHSENLKLGNISKIQNEKQINTKIS